MSSARSRHGTCPSRLAGVLLATCLPAAAGTPGRIDFGPPLIASESVPEAGFRPDTLPALQVVAGPALTNPWLHPGPLADLDRCVVQADPAGEFLELRLAPDPDRELRILSLDVAAEGDEEIVPSIEVIDGEGRVAVQAVDLPVEGLGGHARRLVCETAFARVWFIRIRVAHDSGVTAPAIGLDNIRIELRTDSGLPAGRVTIARGDGTVILRWDDRDQVLEAADAPDGTWRIEAFQSPFTVPSKAAARWFRAAPAGVASAAVPSRQDR